MADLNDPVREQIALALASAPVRAVAEEGDLNKLEDFIAQEFGRRGIAAKVSHVSALPAQMGGGLRLTYALPNGGREEPADFLKN